MKKTTILLLLSFFLGPLSINAQNSAFQHSCGTSIETQEVLFKNMVELRNRYSNVVTSRAIAYIPVWFHLVAKSDGTGRTTEANVAEMLCEWNKIYTANALDMQFYIKGFTKIDYDALYNGPQSFDGSNRMAATKKADGMNIYLVNNAGTGSEPAGSIILAYYANRQTTTDAEYASDWIVCSNSQVNASNATTIAHESGHFFTLSHTFYAHLQVSISMDGLFPLRELFGRGRVKIVMSRAMVFATRPKTIISASVQRLVVIQALRKTHNACRSIPMKRI
jgi:hypothetical protein